jgi:hypothetical protein
LPDWVEAGHAGFARDLVRAAAARLGWLGSSRLLAAAAPIGHLFVAGRG